MDINSFLNSIKEEIDKNQHIEKIANQTNEDVNLDDLEIKIEPVSMTNLEKIASEIDNISSLDELIKIAEETNNKDLSNLIKIADFISEKISDKIIEKLNNIKF